MPFHSLFCFPRFIPKFAFWILSREGKDSLPYNGNGVTYDLVERFSFKNPMRLICLLVWLYIGWGCILASSQTITTTYYYAANDPSCQKPSIAIAVGTMHPNYCTGTGASSLGKCVTTTDNSYGGCLGCYEVTICGGESLSQPTSGFFGEQYFQFYNFITGTGGNCGDGTSVLQLTRLDYCYNYAASVFGGYVKYSCGPRRQFVGVVNGTIIYEIVPGAIQFTKEVYYGNNPTCAGISSEYSFTVINPSSGCYSNGIRRPPNMYFCPGYSAPFDGGLAIGKCPEGYTDPNTGCIYSEKTCNQCKVLSKTFGILKCAAESIEKNLLGYRMCFALGPVGGLLCSSLGLAISFAICEVVPDPLEYAVDSLCYSPFLGGCPGRAPLPGIYGELFGRRAIGIDEELMDLDEDAIELDENSIGLVDNVARKVQIIPSYPVFYANYTTLVNVSLQLITSNGSTDQASFLYNFTSSFLSQQSELVNDEGTFYTSCNDFQGSHISFWSNGTCSYATGQVNCQIPLDLLSWLVSNVFTNVTFNFTGSLNVSSNLTVYKWQYIGNQSYYFTNSSNASFTGILPINITYLDTKNARTPYQLTISVENSTSTYTFINFTALSDPNTTTLFSMSSLMTQCEALGSGDIPNINSTWDPKAVLIKKKIRCQWT